MFPAIVYTQTFNFFCFPHGNSNSSQFTTSCSCGIFRKSNLIPFTICATTADSYQGFSPAISHATVVASRTLRRVSGSDMFHWLAGTSAKLWLSVQSAWTENSMSVSISQHNHNFGFSISEAQPIYSPGPCHSILTLTSFGSNIFFGASFGSFGETQEFRRDTQRKLRHWVNYKMCQSNT